jgi:hypothetical protein
MKPNAPGLDLTFMREEMPPPPQLGPDGYTRLIRSVWLQRTEDDVKRYLNDKGNRPVNVWFRLDGRARTDR